MKTKIRGKYLKTKFRFMKDIVISGKERMMRQKTKNKSKK